MDSFEQMDSSDIFALCHDAIPEDNAQLIQKALPWIDKQDGLDLLEKSAKSGSAETFKFLAGQLFSSNVMHRLLPFLCTAVKADQEGILIPYIDEIKSNPLCFSRVFMEATRHRSEKCFDLVFPEASRSSLATCLLDILSQGSEASATMRQKIMNGLTSIEVMSVVVSYMGSARLELSSVPCNQTSFLDDFVFDLNKETFELLYPKVHRLAKSGLLPQVSSRYARQQLLDNIGDGATKLPSASRKM